MTLYPELDNLSLDELIACLHGPPLDGAEYARAYYDEVAIHIQRHGAAGIALLLGQIHHPDADRAGAIILALTFPQPEPAGLRDILLSHLRDERPWVVARAVDALRLLGEKRATAAIAALHDHPSPYVRGRVLAFLRHHDPEAALPRLLAALKDQDYIIRETAVDELDEMGTVEALPAIRPLLADPHPEVRQAVQGAMRRLEERLRNEA